MSGTEIKTLRIFVASPSDMATERSRVQLVASVLQPLAERVGLVLKVDDWRRVVPDAGRAEDVILKQLKPSSWDAFVGILWHRFGTPTGNKDAETQREYLSGTEEEFKIAYRLWEKYQRPRIMMYRCVRPVPPDLLDGKQFDRLKDFFAQFDAADGAHPGLYQSFDTTESFEHLLFDNLQRLLLEYGEATPGKSVSIEIAQTLIPATNNLPRRPQFFGRKNELKRVLAALDPEDRSWGALLDGLGGIGKTSLAIEVAYQSKERKLFDAFVFISAKDNLLSPRGIREMSPMARTLDEFVNETIHVLGETGIAELSGNEKSRALTDVFRNTRVLLIYDNLETLTNEDQEALANFLRTLPQGCKAITTSRYRVGEGAVWVRLERLEWAASLEIIQSEISRDPVIANKMQQVEDDRWQELDELTKGSPLALVHTLGLLRFRPALTFDGALELLRSSKESDLQTFVFNEARRELTHSDEIALCALSVFEMSATFDAWMYVSELSPEDLESSILRLDALALLDITWEQSTYALHTLTRNFVRDELLQDSQMATQFASRMQRYLYGPKPEASSASLPGVLQPLEDLAANYWWSWAADGSGIFRDLDSELWEESEHNPRLLLSRLPEYSLLEMATDPVYTSRLRRLSDLFNSYFQPKDRVSWGGITPEHPVAYFCAEYGVHASLPIYSGGLGILAGDHLKSASDLRLPLVAIGLLYRYGYFRQRLRRDGWQEEHYGEIYPPEVPLQEVCETDGSPLLITVHIRNRAVKARVWCAAVGRVSLYLLDTNIAENAETDRWITGHLYGGDRETRLIQEMLLGIGGIRLLRKLKIEPHVFHLNEGHSALLTLELARELIQSEGLDFNTAAKKVRERCIFTTHTSVAAGNDEFDLELIKRCFGAYVRDLGLAETEFQNLGQIPGISSQRFGLTPLAIRMCRSTNGVSRRHGEISRRLWQPLWPECPVEKVPITHVTNGIHLCTWVAPPIRAVYERLMGPDWFEKARHADMWASEIEKIPDEELWRAHSLLKHRLIGFLRHASLQSRITRGDSAEQIEAARKLFNPEVLTIGFARRVAGYKRWTLLLSDPGRLLRLINNEDCPIQFVIAGKAHPQDEGSKLILRELIQWVDTSKVHNRIVFLEDFNQEIARQFVQSIDVWLTTSRPSLEASSTSGQKVAINGGLNLGMLGGWWLEAYDGTNGFAIGDARETNEFAVADLYDAESLYRALELEVVPLYYHRDENGLPRHWIGMMKRSIQTLVPNFNSDRMVSEYAKRIYAANSDG